MTHLTKQGVNGTRLSTFRHQGASTISGANKNSFSAICSARPGRCHPLHTQPPRILPSPRNLSPISDPTSPSKKSHPTSSIDPFSRRRIERWWCQRSCQNIVINCLHLYSPCKGPPPTDLLHLCCIQPIVCRSAQESCSCARVPFLVHPSIRGSSILLGLTKSLLARRLRAAHRPRERQRYSGID